MPVIGTVERVRPGRHVVLHDRGRKGSNMSEQLLDWFLLHAKDPVPCDICRTPTSKTQLTECWVPAYVSEELGFVVRRAMWVCPTCPVP